MCKELAERVRVMKLNSNIEDRLCWAKDKAGEFSVKKCIELLMMDDGEIINFDCRKLGKIKVPPKENLWWISPLRCPVIPEAEIGAVKIAFEVLLATEWKSNVALIIEVRSSLVFFWCVNKAMRPWSIQLAFKKIEVAMLKVGIVVFSLADKKGNDMAFSFAMAGVNRAQLFQAWW
ncbi:hypothetical protein J1N35_037046 [Gossypium stocksii]|uniref:RNase H type-1 domain-containing protein n=1 Tax=Gossypium stocksii TaxID=47602 RepID=A0A9D3ZLE6_9ROSI|nr:hypothetical protein J1N35_037046 [Gossypium stocksii]